MKSVINWRFSLIIIVVCGLVIFPAVMDYDYVIENRDNALDDKFWNHLGQTTSGIASGLATPDGRPLVWKNRDRVSREQMEYHYVDDGRIPFISVTDVNVEYEYYGGLNAEGFAVENTDAHNFPLDNPPENGWGREPDDGETMKLALATCRTVDDFAALLDSLNVDGRTYNFTYRAIDAFGGASLFETAAYTYYRYDAIDAPGGFMVRSNFAYAGPDPSSDDARYGIHRHDRSMALWRDAVEHGRLTPQFILQVGARDISTRFLDPYPLPFDGYDGEFPYGLVNNAAAVGRLTTRATIVAQGVRPGENPADAILWSVASSPLAGVATPLWVRAGSVPEEYDGPERSRLSNRMIQLRAWLYETDINAIDTWRLTNPSGTGLWDYLDPLQNWIFTKTERFLNHPDFDYNRLVVFQNEIAQQVADSLDAWKPLTTFVNEISEPIFWGRNLTIRWRSVQHDGLGNPRRPRGYAVYRSEQPFREQDRGQVISELEGTSVVDYAFPSRGAFYRIEAKF